MIQRPVLFIDSGIGGLPYARRFLAANPSIALVYVADRANYPYGPKDRASLEALLAELAERLIAEFDPCLAVLACNTASISALPSLREQFSGVPWVGTVPAIKPAVRESRSRHVGVLGTRRTIEDPYIGELARRYGPDCAVSRIAAPELVDFVEQGGDAAPPEEQRRVVEPYVREFRRRGADGVVLGCTHFLFLLDSFRALAAPEGSAGGLRIYDSLAGVSRRAEALLASRPPYPEGAEGAKTSGTGDGRENLLVLSGAEAPEERWQARAAAFGLRLRLLDGKGA